MSDRESKQFSGVIEFKGPREGSFTATFATFNVVDHDGDVTLPGAFKDGSAVIIGSWGHKTAELPSGRGVIRTNGLEATVEGQFFLETAPGKDTYATVKGLGSLGEWSYVFQVTKQSYGDFAGQRVRFLHELKVYSVDPVLAGAGINTRTTAIKASGGWRVELERYREKNELRLAEIETRKILAAIGPFLEEPPKDYREVPDWIVPPSVSRAATEAASASAAQRGIRVPQVKWFTQPFGVAQVLGFCWPGKADSAVWVRSQLSPSAAYEVVSHEVAHLSEDAKMDPDANEAAAKAFAREMTVRAATR